MKAVFDQLRNELENFWLWANQTSYEYAKHIWKQKQEEWEYPNWNRLMNLTIEVIKDINNGEKSKQLVDCILEVMALDNEDEQILDECEGRLTYNDMSYIVPVAIVHMQSEARWQIAELLGRYKNLNASEYLRRFVEDENKYVQRRAIISLAKINPYEAEKICLTKLNDEDDYLRLVSLKILREIKSNSLGEAIIILKNDRFDLIQKEIEEIMMG